MSRKLTPPEQPPIVLPLLLYVFLYPVFVKNLIMVDKYHPEPSGAFFWTGIHLFSVIFILTTTFRFIDMYSRRGTTDYNAVCLIAFGIISYVIAVSIKLVS